MSFRVEQEGYKDAYWGVSEHCSVGTVFIFILRTNYVLDEPQH